MTDVNLNDSGIWVTRTSDNLVGRFNYSAGALDGSLRTESTQFDISQDGLDVISRDVELASVQVIDPTALSLGPKSTVAADFQMQMGGGRLAVYDQESGSLWLMNAQDAAGFSPASTAVAAELEVGATMTMGADGTTYVLQPSTASLATVSPDGEVKQTAYAGLAHDATVAMTVVGTTPVVLDRSSGTLYLSATTTVTVEGAGEAALQAPGPAADAVVFATAVALISQPLNGGTPIATAAAAAGLPAQPVVVAGCSYGVWNGSAAFVRDCPGTKDDQQSVVPDSSGATQLRFRVNNGNVVLNDLKDGAVWLVDDQLTRVDDWQDVMPDDSQGDQQQEQTLEVPEDQMPDRTQENHPPVANDDVFGARPGRTTVLPVVDNDTDEDGDLLTVKLAGDPPSLGNLQTIYADTAMQITLPDDATGSDSFSYQVSDGRGGTDEAQVRVEVHPWDHNEPPEQLRQGSIIMAAGQSATYNVLPNWRDPDGDDIYLESAVATSEGDSVQFRADGQVTFQDSGHLAGKKVVSVTVSDGTQSAEGSVVFDVRPSGVLPPVANPDHVVGYVGREITVAPLANDTDPSGLTLRLAQLQEVATATVVADTQAGTFTVTSDQVQTLYLTYTVSNGPATAQGLVRVDIVDPPQQSLPPVAVADVALVPAGGSVLVDVLANDLDPTGGVLVLQATDVPAGSPIAAAVVDHRYVRVSELRAFSEPVRFTYTVSNGVDASTGQVTAVPVAAPAKLQPPVANDDEVNVRVGDIVTINVLANDYHPNGAPLKLLPDLLEQPDPADGLIFTSGNQVRFHAGDNPTTVTAVYQVTDEVNEPDSARITIHILAMDPDRNSPPRPKALEARTLSGQTVRVTVPLDGIDPDGDFTTLVGIAKAPAKGTVTVGDSWIEYTAGRDQVGLDSFTYMVQDRLGARATATVLVGIAPPTGINRPPVPVDDKVFVRPDRAIAIPVLANDVDPDGDKLHLVEGSLNPDEVPGATDVRILGTDHVALRTPAQEGSYTLHYTVADVYDASAVGAAVIEVGADAPLKAPIAADDIVTPDKVVGLTSVNVPVLDNDEDPDGSRAELEVALVDPSRGTVKADKTVEIPVTDALQIIDYQVTDVDGLTGKAFIVVPSGAQTMLPTLNVHAKALEVKAGESLTIKLADHVTVSAGKHAIVTEAASLTALGGVATLVGNDQVTYAAGADYSGPGSVSMEVTDGTGPDDPQGQKAMVQIPITVLPKDNQPPTFTSTSADVAAGEQVQVDLSKLATDPDPADMPTLQFALTGQPPAGLSATLKGSMLTVTADRSTAKGTVATLAVTVTDGKSDPVPAAVLVTVVSSKLPLPKAVDDAVPDAQQGKAVDVPVLANDSNPYPDQPLRLISATVETGEGTAAVNGQNVRVTPGPVFGGRMVVRYRIGDATQDPDREVDGRIDVTVKGRPDPVVGVKVDSIADRTVVLSWQPAQNNGSPITTYKVTSSQGYSKSCGTQTTCTLDGLTNNVTYTFQVVATNAVGDSDPSAASADARPDALPDIPAAPALRFGDRSLAVRWATPASSGSPVEAFNLQIDPAPPSGQAQKTRVSGNELTWDGLTNGVAYRVRVCAINQAAGACTQEAHWSPWSSTEIPAAAPDAPGQPTVARLDPVGSQAQLRVDWAEPAANGDAIASYSLKVMRGGSAINTIQVDGGTLSQAVVVDVNETNYTFQVTATNKAGTSAPSAASNPMRAFVAPGKVGNLAATDRDNSATITFDQAARNGASSGEITYMYRVAQTGVEGTLSSGSTITGLGNNGTYTVDVWARTAVDGTSYDGEHSTVGGIRPYGTPGAPNASAAQEGTQQVKLSWSPPGPNGRAIVRLEIRIDGGGWEQVPASSGSRVVGNGYSQTHSVEVRAVDEAGQTSASRSASATSQAPPPPPRTVTVWKGGVAINESLGCYSNGPCYYLDGSIGNFSPNASYTAECHNKNGTWRSFVIGTDKNGSAGIAGPCFSGNGFGGEFWITIDGVESNHVFWGY